MPRAWRRRPPRSRRSRTCSPRARRRRLLRPPGAVEHPAVSSSSRSPSCASSRCSTSTTPRAWGEVPRQVRGRGLAVARARRCDVAVRRHLPGHGRWRPAELRGDLAGAAVALEHPLDRVPLVPREPPVRPPGRLRSGHFSISSIAVGDSGPSGVAYPDSRLRTQRNALR